MNCKINYYKMFFVYLYDLYKKRYLDAFISFLVTTSIVFANFAIFDIEIIINGGTPDPLAPHTIITNLIVFGYILYISCEKKNYDFS